MLSGRTPWWPCSQRGAALLAWGQSRKLLHFEHERDERAQARAEREQATRISSWSVICKQHVAQEREVTVGILVRNASETPVHNVAVSSALHNGRLLEPAFIGVLPARRACPVPAPAEALDLPRPSGRGQR